MQTVFIEHFPLGHPRAPIGAPHLSTMTGSGVTSPGDSLWTPFLFQCDWEIARWAKTHRVTTSAFLDLLAISEVQDFDLSNSCSADVRYRSLSGLNYPMIR